MSDKFEALSQPVAVMFADGDTLNKEQCGETFDICCQAQSPLYSQDYVTALLAALEEKNQGIAELNVKLFDQSILLDAAISRAEAAGRREEHLKADVAVMGNRIAELETGHSEAAKQISSWRNLAKQNIAEREKDIAALEAAKQRNSELEQRLQQPIKLPNKNDDEFWFGSTFQVAKFDRAVERAILAAGFKFKGE
ncbi:hypothetical protein J8631_09735 [Serratia fonticola]|uniref:hypothetical protein n=1 Tax=Serratia fonticola TaxID=47917 RepID=UPI001AE3FAAA|nr:hypothetical protein [Serratia fonticola]MBP1035839.1 hypothetical protein [Serratia fonticola]